MSSCDVCSKSFKRRDNMLRHKRNTHIEDEQDDRGDISSDSDENMDDDSEVDTDNSDDSAGSESDDVWDSLIKIELCELQSAYEEKVKDVMKLKSIRESRARSDVYKEMRPLYRRAIIKRFVARLLWFDSIRRDGVYKAIRASAERLRTEEDMVDKKHCSMLLTNGSIFLTSCLVTMVHQKLRRMVKMMIMRIPKVIRSCVTYKHHGFYICYYRFELHERESD